MAEVFSQRVHHLRVGLQPAEEGVTQSTEQPTNFAVDMTMVNHKSVGFDAGRAGREGAGMTETAQYYCLGCGRVFAADKSAPPAGIKGWVISGYPAGVCGDCQYE
jgi:hypothetical protein